MATIGLVHDLWVLVCDGQKALLFQNVGDRVYPKLETRETFAHPAPATREIGTDAPGRNFSSVADGRRGAMDQTDFHTLEEQRFLVSLARHLDRYAVEHGIRKLVIAAPPRALGTIREALTQNLKSIVRAELDKDYVAEPVYEIEKRLAHALAK